MDEIQPAPFPALHLPVSAATVRVKAIDSTTRMVVNAHAFVQPPIAQHATLNLNTMCFLLGHRTQHDDSGDSGSSYSEYVLFDCGSRKDFWNGSPQTNKMIVANMVGKQVDYGVDEILTSTGFDLSNLSETSSLHILYGLI